jgi:hypothetical protein
LSLIVKYQWPELALVKFDISPLIQTESKPSVRTFFTSRFTSETEKIFGESEIKSFMIGVFKIFSFIELIL